jgi:putative glycerol-1-phosphate prenyltransferase
MKTHNYLLETISQKGAAYLILIDPDKISDKMLEQFISTCEKSGVDGFLIGGSLLLNENFEFFTKKVKENSNLPIIIFPGAVNQVNPFADAIFFISVVSGRNPEHLIGNHVIAAPLIKSYNLEAISVGYILVESGRLTTAQYMNGSLPIPRDKNEIACATALAAEYLGMKFIYLEAGSGAENSVPNEMIYEVSRNCSIPVIVGGGIKNPTVAKEKVKNGAKVIVIGNHFEDRNTWDSIKVFGDAIHSKISVNI